MTASTTTAKKAAPRRKTATKHPLEALIPDPSIAETYIVRYFEDYPDLDLMRYADNSNMNVLLEGPTGPGKTRAVFSYGSRERKPVVTAACNGGIDPSTFWGQYRKEEDGSITFLESTILQVIRFGGILYLDELNFLHPRIGAVFHGLTDQRRAIVVPELGNLQIEAHPDLLIVAAYNPDYQGTRPLNEAFKNRFAIKLTYDYDKEIEAQLIPLVEGTDASSLLDFAEKLRGMVGEGVISTPVSTNMLVEFVQIAFDTDYSFAVTNFVNAFHSDERQAVKNNFDLMQDEIGAFIEATKAAG